jgi:hypothetical protein
MEKLGVGVTCRLAGFFGKSWFLLYRKLKDSHFPASPAKRFKILKGGGSIPSSGIKRGRAR